ncbi:MAG: GDP-mannose 4,6-dehydratase [Chitinophagales bacterium]|nr:GDP-mannose 4,6-dehydratase [Chitinophagales bacterium]
MHILITGGAGFIGSNLTRTILEKYPAYRVTCVDNFDPFYPRAIKEFNIKTFLADPRYRFIEMDIADNAAAALAAELAEPVDVIVHIAAKAGVRPSIENPMAYQQANVIGLQQLLDFARAQNVKQFVFASSSSVYGINDHYPWKEDEQLLPISPYAGTKLSGEMMGHVYSKLFGIRFLALRFFTVYGPGQRPDLAIHKFTKAILQGKPIPMYGDGSTSRDYTYVGDTVKGIIGAIHYTETPFEIINLGNNYTVSLKELISAIEEVTGKQAVVEQFPEQQGDVPRTFADISKARKLLGYDPSTQLKDGLTDFYNWFVANRELLTK